MERWSTPNRATNRYEAYVKGPLLLLQLGEAPSQDGADAAREARLDCELARKFVQVLGESLEARALACRLEDLEQRGHTTMVTTGESVALARSLKTPAQRLRKLIEEADQEVLARLLPGSHNALKTALDQIISTAATSKRAIPRHPVDLPLYQLASAWLEVYGEPARPTTGFLRVFRTWLAHRKIRWRVADEIDWLKNALSRLLDAAPIAKPRPPEEEKQEEGGAPK